MTYTRIGAILHEIGMVSEAQMHRTLAEAANYADEPLEEHYEAACALEEFGVAVSVHADDIDPRTWRYLDFERQPHRGYDSIMVLATPEQAQALQARLAFTFPN
ncbi:hypothetical protein [Streptomyces chrestomyceticus]|uniref:hypothetical protein n=1 Tax=Streptomyces chrestomyceticus TaxID=68185 RepID=UPI0037ACF6E5